MLLSQELDKFLTDSKLDDAYWVEMAKLDFSLELENQRRRNHMSYADIARRIKSSAAYISKIFRGDANLTIESMVKLARASGGELSVKIVPAEAPAKTWGPRLAEASSPSPRIRVIKTSASVSTLIFQDDKAKLAA